MIRIPLAGRKEAGGGGRMQRASLPHTVHFSLLHKKTLMFVFGGVKPFLIDLLLLLFSVFHLRFCCCVLI